MIVVNRTFSDALLLSAPPWETVVKMSVRLSEPTRSWNKYYTATMMGRKLWGAAGKRAPSPSTLHHKGTHSPGVTSKAQVLLRSCLLLLLFVKCLSESSAA